MNRLMKKYNKEIVPKLKIKFDYKNINSAPKIIKTVVNCGIGKYLNDEKIINQIEEDLKMITGQKPQKRPARKSIAGFKIREGLVIGFKITLRKKMMYDFLDRLISTALPRSKDFRGLDLKGIDKDGNLNIGVKEQIIFPEASSSRMIFGFEITVVTDAKSREEAIELYRDLGFPLKSVFKK